MSADLRPYLLLGERRRRALEDRIRGAAERWALHWAGSSGDIAVAMEPDGGNGANAAGMRRASTFGARARSGRWLAQVAASRSVSAWAAQVPAHEAPTEAEEGWIARGLDLELLESLWAGLRPEGYADSALERLDGDAADAARHALGRRVFSVACQFGVPSGLVAHWTLSAEAVAGILREHRTPYAGEPMGSRVAALAQTPLALDCDIGSIQIPVGDLHALKPGDVLVTDLPLDGRVQIRIRGGSAVASGSIGEHAGLKAIRVETTNRGTNR
jgi:flagellar motor switch/type III secretory pathway protein FliN